MPSVVFQTVCGVIVSYGLAGLRYTGAAITLTTIIVKLQALVATQFQILAVWLTPNQCEGSSIGIEE